MEIFEFVIAGPPVSQQTRRRQRLVQWKQVVHAAASAFWPAGASPFTGPVSVTIFYFFEAVAVDVDNIAKPIHDALIGLAYGDDLQVSDSVNRRRDLQGDFLVPEMTPVLAGELDQRREFLYVRVAAAPEQGELRFS